MKPINIFFGTLLAASTFTACSKQLDQYSQSELSSETYWTTETEARLAVNSCYSFLSNSYAVGSPVYNALFNEAFADNGYGVNSWDSDAQLISAGAITPSGMIYTGYDYTRVSLCNNVLTNISKVPMDETLKKRYIAEARALRAFWYFLNTQYYGPMPLVTDYTNDPKTLDITPVSQDKLFDFITSELDAASTDLPDSYSGSGAGNEKGRVTKWAAIALEARAYLYRGNWAKAAELSKKIIDGGQFKLFRVNALTSADMADDYSNLVTFGDDNAKTKFYKGLRSYEKQFWAENDYNSEVIFDAGFVQNSPYSFSTPCQLILPPSYVGGWTAMLPTQALVDAYWKADGTMFTPPSNEVRASNYNGGEPNAAYFNEFKNRDTRLYASVVFPGNSWNALIKDDPGGLGTGICYWSPDYNPIGYNLRKMVDPNYVLDWTSPQNFPLVRYAEILLTYAEAQNEASGPDASVYAALNDIRDRSGMPAVTPGLSKDAMRDVIRNERRIELAGEGFRYDDLRRWYKGQEQIEKMQGIYSIDNTLIQPRDWQLKDSLLPYPQDAVDRNPALKDAQTGKGY